MDSNCKTGGGPGSSSLAGKTVHLVYDGTFDGFMSTLAVCYRKKIVPNGISFDPPYGLFADFEQVETDVASSDMMQATLVQRLGPAALRTVSHAFRSDAPGKEMMIWNYLQLGREKGRKLTAMLSHEAVLAVNALAFRVRHEAHRLKGFVRFQEVKEGFYYAAIEPDHDVLDLIAQHFADRFHDQHWVIHDLRREKAIIYDRKRREWLAVPFVADSSPNVSEREGEFLALWQTFFAAVTIDNRKNLSLQRRKVPGRYRRHLPEFSMD